ncbi:MAG: EutN/CcmL family microcompartment protein [Opitutales bacterium]
MRLGRVIGRVTLSEDDPAFHGARWLLVSPLTRAQLREGPPYAISTAATLVVYDGLGAGIDEIVGYVEGAEATQPFAVPTPVDALVVCLVDRLNYQPPAQTATVTPAISKPPDTRVAVAPLK